MNLAVGAADVCKARLEILEQGSERAYSIDNDAAAITAWLDGMPGELKLAMEPKCVGCCSMLRGRVGAVRSGCARVV
jgi:hypothetical protein